MKCNGAVPDSRRVREYWSVEIWIIIGKRSRRLHNNNKHREKLILTNTAKFEGVILWRIVKRRCSNYLLRTVRSSRKNKIMKEFSRPVSPLPFRPRAREWSCLSILSRFTIYTAGWQWREKFNTGPFRKAGKRGGWWIIECSRESVNSRASRYVGAADDTIWAARWFKKTWRMEKKRACILPSRCPEQVKRYLYPAGRTIR